MPCLFDVWRLRKLGELEALAEVILDPLPNTVTPVQKSTADERVD